MCALSFSFGITPAPGAYTLLSEGWGAVFLVTMAVRVRKRSLLAVLGAVVLLAAGVMLLGGRPAVVQTFLRRTAEVKCGGTEEGAQWLLEQGWETDGEPSRMEVLIPGKFDQIYESYNDIQKGQGFDISRYRGEAVTKYTYLVKNYPGEPEGVAANLLVYQGRIIGADLCSLELGGFLKGVKDGAK